MSSIMHPSQNDICSKVVEYISAQLDSGRLELPVLPMVATEVLTSSLDEDSNAEKVSNLIQQDQSMAARVLRVVNSPAFRGSTEIIALQQAIARLGLNYIREIAVTAALSGIKFEQKEYQPVAERAWTLALAAGLWTKEIARTCRKNVEVAYLCGLLHNIGVPLVLKMCSDASDEILDEEQVKVVLDSQATPTSLVLSRSWQIPEPMLVAIENWNKPDYTGDHHTTVVMTRAGIKMAQWMLDSELEISKIIACPDIQALDIYPEDAEELLALEEKITISMESIR